MIKEPPPGTGSDTCKKVVPLDSKTRDRRRFSSLARRKGQKSESDSESISTLKGSSGKGGFVYCVIMLKDTDCSLYSVLGELSRLLIFKKQMPFFNICRMWNLSFKKRCITSKKEKEKSKKSKNK